MKPATKSRVVATIVMGSALSLTQAFDLTTPQVSIETRFIETSIGPMRELGLDWARTQASVSPNQAAATGLPADDQAWAAYWRNEAGRLASQLVGQRLARQTGVRLEVKPEVTPEGGVQTTVTPVLDPNARFRAAATPEENLARVGAPKINLDSDYVAKPRPGEPIGIIVDYAKIETMIHRYPAEPTSTVPIIPPVFGPGYGGAAPMPGFGGFGPGFFGAPWPGYIGCGTWRPPCVSPCLLAAPVCYNPFSCGGISGGFFYRSRHFGVGFGF